MSFVAKRCGVQLSPPAIVLIYENKGNKTLRKRVMPVRSFSKYSDCSMAAERLKNNSRHREYLAFVSQGLLEKLHILLRDHMRGLSMDRSLASFRLDPNEDLNKLDDEELALKKGQMDNLFERNKRHKDDPNFVYDLEIDFSKTPQEKCSWDEESEKGF